MKKLDLFVYYDKYGRVADTPESLILVRHQAAKQFKECDKKQNKDGFKSLIESGDIILAPLG